MIGGSRSVLLGNQLAKIYLPVVFCLKDIFHLSKEKIFKAKSVNFSKFIDLILMLKAFILEKAFLYIVWSLHDLRLFP